ncbi:unnamed protein product (mitochondrion) [Plasmodiophora brassicae]|uniref:ubiquitinyl hydrolase 1 n=1 Tax=Plasmodiophora brassicae TaxID=37360 RepID=A0A0G4J455_PLABS|nr:hypothetical protein PBRA_002374 [Plasmodiophora brassicae]SPQ93698.1 unnamed protein product [Plasmodiophora brassicae]
MQIVGADGREAGEPTDEAIIRQHDDIRAKIAEEHPLVSPLAPIRDLLTRETRNNVVSKINELDDRYDGIRRVRGDGNCFFRSYLLAVFTRIAGDQDKFATVLDNLIARIESSKAELIEAGFPDFAVEDFWDEFRSQLHNLKDSRPTPSQVEETFADQSVSDYLVMYARLLTSWYLQTNADQFQPYIQDYPSIEKFVKAEVEPMGKEADHLHCLALASCLGVGVQIEYLDHNPGPISHVTFPEDSTKTPIAFVLYRPGHYDALQPKSQ